MSDTQGNGVSKLSNPLLAQTEERIEAGLSDTVRDDYLRTVVAGMHIAMANGGEMLAPLAKAPDPIAGAAKGAVGLAMIMKKDARGVLPMKALVPAAMVLFLHALDFIDRSKIAPIGNAELVRGTHIFSDYLFARMGITKQGIANAANKMHALTQDPAAMHQIGLKSGVLVHPMAARPTPLPGGMINQPDESGETP